MNLIKLLLQASWPTVVMAAIAGGLSGGCTVSLIALIATALRQSQPPSLLALGGFIGCVEKTDIVAQVKFVAQILGVAT